MAIPTPSSQEILDVLPPTETTWRMTLGAQVEPGGVRFRCGHHSGSGLTWYWKKMAAVSL